MKKYLRKIIKSNSEQTDSKNFNFDSNVLQVKIAYNKFGAYCIPLSSVHRNAVKEVANGGVYEKDTLEFIRENAGDGDVVHAGAFFGDFIPAISRFISINSKLWAFEPNYESFRCAQITMKLNNLKNVSLTFAGLGDDNSEKSIIVNENGKYLGGGSRIVNSKNSENTNLVRVLKLDDFIPKERKISIIQLDVEGYEFQALMGGLNIIQRDKPILVLEDNNEAKNLPWFKENILGIGYEYLGRVHLNDIYVNRTVE